MERRLVAIHQPNFLPWLGYFDKLHRADCFILMDNAQFQKTGGTWTNRVQFCIAGAGTWATVPVDRTYHGYRAIRDMEINDSTPWRDKLLRSLQMNYGRAPHFAEIFPLVREIVENPTTRLSDFNIFGIRRIMQVLGSDESKLVLGSDLAVEGQATDLLISMVRAVNGTGYLCGGGASYQEDDKFEAAALELVYQSFKHPQYPQSNAKSFVAGLSIVDALMNLGPGGTRELFG